MTSRRAYLANKRTPLTDPGTEILNSQGASLVLMTWYKKVVNVIQRESRMFWEDGGDDLYVDALARWAKNFYKTVPHHDVDELKAFYDVITQFFRPELFLYNKETAAEITAKYKHISAFKWKIDAKIPKDRRYEGP